MERLIREKVIKENVWVAFDGKEFEEEEDCVRYECEQKFKKIKMYDVYLNETEKFDDAYLFELTSEESINSFIDYTNMIGIDNGNVFDLGIYIYVSDLGEYIDITPIINLFK